MIEHNLLTLLLVVPAFGAVVLLFLPRQWHHTIRRFSVGTLVTNFVLSLLLLPSVTGALGEALARRLPGSEHVSVPDYATGAFQFVEDARWVESLGIGYRLGVDGISLWLVLLTTLLTPIALFGSWTSITTKVKEYAFAFLLLEVGMLGAFFALDLFLFYVFWELMLVPMYLIIGVWGGKDRVYAAVKFFIYTMVGSLLMLVAILYVVAQYEGLTGTITFDLRELGNLVLPYEAQLLCFLAFAVAFAIKVPMFPFHTWLPDAHVQAPTGGSVILAAVMLKLGTYGLLRLAMPLFPLASQELAPTIAVLAIIGILYGAYAAWVQKDVKKLVAYSSVSHMGFIALGMFAMTPQGVNGALLQMLNHGVSTGALFLLVGVIYERRHTRDLDEFGGLAKVMPWYALVFVIVSMSSIGLPGTNGFVGEFMIMSGTFVSTNNPNGVGFRDMGGVYTLFAAAGVIFAAVYMLHAVLKMFWGPVNRKENEGLADLGWREWTSVAPLLVLIFYMGVNPSVFLDASAPAVEGFIADFNQRYRDQVNDDTLRVVGQPVQAAASATAAVEGPAEAPVAARRMAAEAAAAEAAGRAAVRGERLRRRGAPDPVLDMDLGFRPQVLRAARAAGGER
ncbi:MAG: NADH-quinone oxidoreductase subunit M [Myxococcota bacterium]